MLSLKDLLAPKISTIALLCSKCGSCITPIDFPLEDYHDIETAKKRAYQVLDNMNRNLECNYCGLVYHTSTVLVEVLH
jgi:hypothetical protein